MMDDLEEKGLLDNTTILMFGDHNSYYQQLSNYVKDIEDYNTDNYYTDLYKVPLMIYDSDLGHQVIDKYTCTADIAPTLLDLTGINYYSNLYYGHSIFDDEESVMYSRAYGFFSGEGIVARSLNSILYKAPSVGKEYEEYFDNEARKLVEKIKYCDQIFYQDYFADEEHYDKFVEKMKTIN
jgi:phosphoglycerol transferase MdoB-like AlkP superfamily enzyme